MHEPEIQAPGGIGEQRRADADIQGPGEPEVARLFLPVTLDGLMDLPSRERQGGVKQQAGTAEKTGYNVELRGHVNHTP